MLISLIFILSLLQISKINFRTLKYQHHIISIIANIYAHLKGTKHHAFLSIHYCISLLRQLHEARVIEEHVPSCMANKVLGLGFEVSSLTPEPTHPLSGYIQAVRETGKQGLDLYNLRTRQKGHIHALL